MLSLDFALDTTPNKDKNLILADGGNALKILISAVMRLLFRSKGIRTNDFCRCLDHTMRNATHKAHRNSGLHKKKKERFVSTKGMDPKFLRNQRFAKKHNNKKKEEGAEE